MVSAKECVLFRRDFETATFSSIMAFATGLANARDKSGAVAQLGERMNGIHEVRGSIPLGSTIR